MRVDSNSKLQGASLPLNMFNSCKVKLCGANELRSNRKPVRKTTVKKKTDNGERYSPAEIAHLSLLMHGHIRLLGRYFFKIDPEVEAGYIEREWETIQRIVISLQQKTTTQAALVRKLSTYSATHPLVQALAQYDRLLKSMYLLDYIDDATLRSYVQRALNRGEAYHQLRRAIASVNGNRFRGGSKGEIDLWNECARLLANAVIYFNSFILSNLLEHFETVGDEKKAEIVKHVSPVAWINLNLNGTYSFSFDDEIVKMEDVIRPITSETETT